MKSLPSRIIELTRWIRGFGERSRVSPFSPVSLKRAANGPTLKPLLRWRSSVLVEDLLSIGDVARRTGVAVTALRFYEARGLIDPGRANSGHRRYPRETIRRVSFILAAQRVGLSLREVGEALAGLPSGRAPSVEDWSRLSASWRPMLEERIRTLEQLRDQLDSCIGCGCLSLATCALQNPSDSAAAFGPGPRYLMGD